MVRVDWNWQLLQYEDKLMKFYFYFKDSSSNMKTCPI